jgi:hypothetical protein
LDYAPENELGVVYLFSHVARKYGLRVQRVQAGFPDCIAYRGENRVKIEFEYKSRNFRLHKHTSRGCDWVVCWIHNWPGVPKHLQVVELRRDFRLGFNVWFQPVGKYKDTNYADKLAKRDFWRQWTVPSLAIEGDLVLYYRTARSGEPTSCVCDIFRLVSRVDHVKAGYKPGFAFMADIRRVCTLGDPLKFSDLRGNRGVRNAGFVRGLMRKGWLASEHWPELYRMMTVRNPSIKRALRKYAPEREM